MLHNNTLKISLFGENHPIDLFMLPKSLVRALYTTTLYTFQFKTSRLDHLELQFLRFDLH